jgi:hypothetical protein
MPNHDWTFLLDTPAFPADAYAPLAEQLAALLGTHLKPLPPVSHGRISPHSTSSQAPMEAGSAVGYRAAACT